RLPQGFEIDVHRVAVGTLLEISLYFIEECHHCATAVLAELAADKVERLDTVGAFVYLRNARVAHELLHAMFGDVAVAAEYLLRQNRIGKTAIGKHAFDDWRQQPHVIVGALAFLLIRRTM